MTQARVGAPDGRGLPPAISLSGSARERLRARVEEASHVARRNGRPVVASVTEAVDPSIDPSACVLRSRRPGDRFFCLEQPERGAHAIAGLGTAALLTARGVDRFGRAARRSRALGEGALVDGRGPLWLGGFSFADDGGGAPEWSAFAPLQLVLPEVSLIRSADGIEICVTALLEGDEDPRAVTERLEGRVSSLLPGPMPMADPHPTREARVASAAPPEHFEHAVMQAVDRIGRGEIEKVVLARMVRVHAPQPIDPAPVLDGLRTGFPACFSYCVGTPDAAFVGASPELLVRREGARAQTVALAGTTRRSADPAVDAHLGEQLAASPKVQDEHGIVVRRIERTLEPVSLWVAAAEAPVLVKVLNVQHLGTPIRAQLVDPLPALELAGLLHPTPAIGGEPREPALELIPALEGLDRGWYAGGLGWTDMAEDGEFCVAIRCGLLRGDVAQLYSGNGIVADSDPAEELAETEVKLEALLPLLV